MSSLFVVTLPGELVLDEVKPSSVIRGVLAVNYRRVSTLYGLSFGSVERKQAYA